MLGNLKKILSCGLAIVFMLSICSSFPLRAEEVGNNLDYYMSLDANSEEYQEWKTTISASEDAQVSAFSLNKNSSGIYNEYLEFICTGGNYSLGTTGGTPESTTDDNKKLLYGYPSSGTSYTTIRIDEQDYRFVPSYITYDENVIVASNTYNGIKISLCFSFIYNQYTGREDVAEFYYTLENTEELEHSVGVRIMFDTMLGYNDSSPFKIPNMGDTSVETNLTGNNVPEFWQSFDSLSSPSVIAQGTLKMDDSSTPDRVRFTNWSMASRNPWDYLRAEGTYNGDSAVCLYWNPKSMSKGESISCKTHYGLSSLQQDGTPPLAIALTGATRLEVSHNDFETDSYSPNPFTVTAYIQNIGDGLANNVKAKLNIPDSMTIVDGEPTVELGDLEVNSKQYQVTWKVWVEPSVINTIESYSVTIFADNADTKTIQRNIEIPALQDNGPLKLYLNKSCIDSNSVILPLDFKLENSSNDSIDISNYIVRYYFIDEAPNANKIFDVYHCGNQSVNNVPLNITYHSISAPYKNQANAYLEFDFSRASLFLDTNEDIRIYVGIHTNDWHEMLSSNDFSAINSNYNDKQDFILWTKIPIYEKNTGKRVWGTEPKDGIENANPNLMIKCIANKLSNDSVVDMVISIKNNSSVPIDLSKSELFYYYMNDNDYKQKVNINYVGGRINGNWTEFTNKVNAEADLLETKKDRANSVIKLTFVSSVGTLCYNENIDIHLQLYNENWVQGKFDLSNDYSYYGVIAPNYVASNIIFTASYLNNMGDYVEYQYGEPIGNYKPTFSAFKIGEGTEEENILQDYNNFINYFTSNFDGVKYNEYAVAENITSELKFTDKNLHSLLGSDIAYISGHGSRGGVIPIYANGMRPNNIEYYEGEKLYNQILTTDKNIGTDFQDFGLLMEKSLELKNIFSLNMKDHQNDSITENLQWIITGACSQINNDNICNVHPDGKKELNTSSAERWVDVLVNNKKLKGILGYHGQGPAANANHPDYAVIKNFLLYSSPPYDNYECSNIHDAWIIANAFPTHGISDILPCGLIVKDEYDKEYLYDSLINNSDVEYSYIHRYTSKYIDIIHPIEHNDEIIYKKAVDAISTYYSLSVDETEQILENNFMKIEKDTFTKYGEFISRETDEYIFKMSTTDCHISSFNLNYNESINNNILIRYNPNKNTVEEF